MPTAAEIIQTMPEHFNPEKAGDMDVTVQFHLSGEGGGDWNVRIRDGSCLVTPGIAEVADATIRMSQSNYVQLTEGKLNAMAAFISGQIKVQGNVGTVMRMQTLFNL